MNAKELFEKGNNCSQSVFVPFARKFFPNEKLALKMMSPFGGGISHSDNICGAVTGGISAIGLHLGHSDAGDADGKAFCAEATRKFISEFKKKHGSTTCTKLTGYNLSKAGEKKKASEAGVFKSKCSIYVESAVSIVSEILKQE